MEDLLLSIVKESNGSKLASLKQSAQEAHDLLSSQNNLMRSPSHELRTACFVPLKLALESKKSKLVSLSLTGLNKIVRDERFQAGSEPEDDSLWLPTQLLLATSSMLTQCEDTQVHILRVVLNLACSASWALNGRLVMLLISRCGEAYENGTQPIRAAAQAAASQTLTAFCTFLDEECQEILQQQQRHKNSGSSAEMVYTKTSAVACFNEAIPVMQYLCSRLEETKSQPKSSDSMIFLLECLLTLVNTLPHTVHSNIHFTTFLWQRFCPALLSLLGAPGDPTQSLTTNQSKIIYSIGIQVVRLVGRERALRPVLEALFHRILLLPSPMKRLEPLKAARELLRSPGRLADLLLLSGPIHRHAGDDMAIIRLIMDSIEESSQCSDTSVLLASVECVGALLGSLESLCKGEGLNSEAADIANSRYITLEQADYTGPLTYQSLARLPKPYRDVVANLKCQSDSDSSGIEGNVPDIEGGSESDCSGATEGPEEFASQSEDSIMDDDSFLTNQQLQKLHKLPKSLNLGRTGIEECNTDVERHNARHFVKTLQNILLPNLLTLRSSIQVDEVLQEFASKCCQHNSAQNYEISTIMNADGVYLATYSALLLDLKLIQSGHYTNTNNNNNVIPITEAQFVEEIHGSGVLVYISATWLCELYQNVLAKSLLLGAGYEPKSPQQPALISLLIDVGGLCPSQLLCDWQKLQKIHATANETSPENEAGIKLSRRVLTCCWASVVAVLGAPLGERNLGSGSALSRLVARRARQRYKKRIADDVITAALEGLHKAASLSNILKLQSRSCSILALLSASSCKNLGAKLPASHALSLDVLLTKGLALGSVSAPCWSHVFQACVAVANLEHALFSKTGSTQLLMVAQNTQNNTVTSSTYSNTSEKLNLSFNLTPDEETCVDVYSFLHNSYTSLTSQNDASIAEIVEKSGVHNSQSQGILRGVHAAKVCCVLSQKADELFHSAALRLSLPGLCSFLVELCKASHTQLFTRYEEAPRQPKKWWRKDLESQQKPPATLLLHRIGEVTLKCIRSGRPLIHTMKVWSIVGPHFMEAACHKDRTVSKKAVQCIHDSVTALLNEQAELPHFHFNEALIKPFENLLCLELCDLDVQDQIVACLCEFVEANRTEICSGWRPLFGTLRVANPKNNAAAILDVFKIFLSTDNTLVFANAALDYILCLLSHIKNTNFDENDAGIANNNNNNNIINSNLNCKEKKLNATFLDPNSDFPKLILGPVDLCIESLKLLQNCAAILSMMYNMPKCPGFNMTHRMTIDTEPQLVDPVIQNIEVVSFVQDAINDMNYKVLGTRPDLEACDREGITLNKMDRQSNVLKIWYILLEGLSSASVMSATKNQPYVVETLFKLLRDLIDNPGINFGFYCINHLLLPMVQNWLRQNNKVQKSYDVWQNFKHCCGLASELVVDYLHQNQNSANPAATLALKQLLLILIECTAQPNENVARLGSSCIRHVILSSGKILTHAQWEILVVALYRACVVTLNPLYQLIQAFKENSDSFYGDLATVKVAARKDSSVNENERLYELARQVFLMQSQKNCLKCVGKLCDCSDTSQLIDDRSYVFLLYPLDMAAILNPDLYTVRVPFRNLVVGILAHQMLVQTISSALLQNLNHITPILNILQINSCSLRGILTHINAKHVDVLLRCLEVSNLRAGEFDLRPGLKFLTQKVGNLSKAANLYTQANTSEVVCIIVLIELCLDGIEKYSIDPKTLKELLAHDARIKPSSDLDYIEQFLRKLQLKWERLCESYVNLTINITENGQESDDESRNYNQETEAPKPFKFADLKVEEDSLSSSTDSESYLEKDILPNLDPICDQNQTESSMVPAGDEPSETCTKTKKNTIKADSSSTDDETNEMAAKYTKQVYDKYKIELNAIKYDTNTLLQMRKSTISTENCCSDSLEVNKLSTRTNPFMVQNAVPPPQPIPPEIQQQRALSIFKDSEAYKSSKIETMEACLELLSSLSSDKLSPLATVLKQGAVLLVGAPDEKIKNAAEHLLDRMNISYIDHDNF